MTSTSEAASVFEHNLELVENAAYHESGHTVVAVVLGLRLQGYGIHIDKAGKGVSFYEFCDPQIDVSGSHKSNYVLSKGEHSIKSFFAGLIAQKEFCRREKNTPCSNASAADDEDLIQQLVRNLYCSQTPEWREEKSNQLEVLAGDLVGKHWEAIKAVAKALLATDWLTPNQTSAGAQWSPAEEKRLTDAQIRNILQPFGICALPHFAD